MTRQTIIAIEQGRYSPSLEAAFRIARASLACRSRMCFSTSGSALTRVLLDRYGPPSPVTPSSASNPSANDTARLSIDNQRSE
ncbi:MAG TPA: hypothetical protein VMF64_12640 [Steroidobacteraceae bacterium]|nr:hypothetical protein [Steroidobacteraceae bacterium]